MMLSHRSRDKARVDYAPTFHKKRFWQAADQDSPHHDPDHAGFCLRKLETGIYQAMHLHRRHSSSEGSALQSRSSLLIDPTEASPRSLPYTLIHFVLTRFSDRMCNFGRLFYHDRVPTTAVPNTLVSLQTLSELSIPSDLPLIGGHISHPAESINN